MSKKSVLAELQESNKKPIDVKIKLDKDFHEEVKNFCQVHNVDENDYMSKLIERGHKSEQTRIKRSSKRESEVEE